MTHAAPILAVIAAAAACASCAPVDGEAQALPANLSTERQCFFTRQVDGYSEAPDGPRGDRLFVSTGFDDRWLFETFGSCPELDWSQRIALDSRGPSTLCTGDVATVLVPRPLSGRGPDRCTARLLGKVVTP